MQYSIASPTLINELRPRHPCVTPLYSIPQVSVPQNPVSVEEGCNFPFRSIFSPQSVATFPLQGQVSQFRCRFTSIVQTLITTSARQKGKCWLKGVNLVKLDRSHTPSAGEVKISPCIGNVPETFSFDILDGIDSRIDFLICVL